MSIYSTRSAAVGQGVQPWSKTITLFPGGGDVSACFGLYQSLGDVTLTGANTIPTLLDGPEKVVRYGNLTLGDGTTATSLTASNRCKGLTILCDNLTVKANANLNMTARGARVLTNDDPFFPFVDFRIPNQIAITSDSVSSTIALTIIKAQGFAPWDQGTWQALVSGFFGFNLGITQAGTVPLMQTTGCGSYANGGGTGEGYGNNGGGGIGGAGSSGGMGGGGGGACSGYSGGASAGKGGYGCCYSGGSGGGGVYPSYRDIAPPASKYSGPGGAGGGASQCQMSPHTGDPTPTNAGGGGAGNPGGPGAYGGGGNGTGGKLVIIAGTSIIVQSGGKIEANGTPGGGTGYYGGGGSGGGHISIITPTYTNTGTTQASGGSGGGYGGAGGAGSVVTKTFIDMGW